MTQNARVARWIPTVVNKISDVVIATSTPKPDETIDTQFGAAGGGSATVDWASDADMIAGTEAFKANSPLTLRTELAREFGIPAASFATAIAIGAWTGLPATDGNRLVKTNSMGAIDSGFMPPIFDAGTF